MTLQPSVAALRAVRSVLHLSMACRHIIMAKKGGDKKGGDKKAGDKKSGKK